MIHTNKLNKMIMTPNKKIEIAIKALDAVNDLLDIEESDAHYFVNQVGSVSSRIRDLISVIEEKYEVAH